LDTIIAYTAIRVIKMATQPDYQVKNEVKNILRNFRNCNFLIP